MRLPNPQQLLEVVERASLERPLPRGTHLAALAWPQEHFGHDTAGMRNARLLKLRRAMSGPRIACVADCASCGALLEVELDVDEILVLTAGDAGSVVSVEWQNRELRFRVPMVTDIDEVAGSITLDDESAVAALARRCLVEGELGAVPDDELLAMLSAALELADPLGALALELQCPSCQATSCPEIVPGALLWQEVVDKARGLMNDVHALARAYGWSEPEILALPGSRRRGYLAMVNG